MVLHTVTDLQVGRTGHEQERKAAEIALLHRWNSTAINLLSAHILCFHVLQDMLVDLEQEQELSSLPSRRSPSPPPPNASQPSAYGRTSQPCPAQVPQRQVEAVSGRREGVLPPPAEAHADQWSRSSSDSGMVQPQVPPAPDSPLWAGTSRVQEDWRYVQVGGG